MNENTNNLTYTNTLDDSDEFVIVSKNNQTATIHVKDFKNEIKYSASTITGEKGEKGNTGDYGDPGSTGEKGIKGLPGQRGISGQKGRTGQTGDYGDLGKLGPRGETGQKGESGIKGETGNTGFQGKTGKKGESGDKGFRGAFGLRGDSGQTPAIEAEKGDRGDSGDDATYGKRGERGKTGDRGDRGEKGREGSRGKSGKPASDLTHALYGANIFRNYTDLNITSGNYVHLSYFQHEGKIAFKYYKLILEIPDNDNILAPTSDLILNLMVPGDVTNYKPIISGLPPVIWIKDNTDNNTTSINRSNNRVPRNITIGYHTNKTHMEVYIPTKNSDFISENKINLKIKEMFGTNDI